MPLEIRPAAEGSPIGLEELAELLREQRLDPRDQDSLACAAPLLKRLAENRTFLGEVALQELKTRKGLSSPSNPYGPQSMVLVPPSPGSDSFFVRANFWPSPSDHILRAGKSTDFGYEAPHDHSFNFLTVGYLGPGYRSRYYEYEYEQVNGYVGEGVQLRFVEASALSEGRILLYRAFRDVHDQIPGESMSVSVNIMESSPRGGFMDQYGFDVTKMEIDSLLNRVSATALLPVLAAVEDGNAADFLHDVSRSHPSARIRCIALDAMASTGDSRRAEAIYSEGLASGHGQVSGHSERRLAELGSINVTD
jgi:hypothetical protein